MKKVISISFFILSCFFAIGQSPKDRIATNSAYWYNAEDFGIVSGLVAGDSAAVSLTNKTKLQNLINYIGTTKKNSIIYFSKPDVYYFNGAFQDTTHGNAMIKFPNVAITDTQYTLTLKGYVAPTFSPSVYSAIPTPSATILRCLNTTGSNGNGAFLGIGMDTSVSFMVPGLENLIIQTVQNPIITAVDWSYFTCTYIQDVAIMSGYSQYVQGVTQPTHPLSYGLKQPRGGSGIIQRVEGSLNILGFYHGALVGEAAMIDNIGVWSCKEGLVYEFSYGTSHIQRALIGWCPIGINVRAFHNINILALNTEHYLLDSTKWFTFLIDLVDSTNAGVGHIEWEHVDANVGVVHTFTKYKGWNIYDHEIGTYPSIKQNMDTAAYHWLSNVSTGTNAEATYVLQTNGGVSTIGNISTTYPTAGSFKPNSLRVYSGLTGGINLIAGVTGGGIEYSTGNVTTVRHRMFSNGHFGVGQITDSSKTLVVGGDASISSILTLDNDTAIVNTTNNITGLNARFGSMGIQSYATNNQMLNDNITYDNTNFRYLTNGYGLVHRFLSGGYTINTAPSGSAGAVATVTPVFGITNSGITNLFKGANVTSASAIVPTGNSFHVTGTTTITSITTTGLTAGTVFTIIFDGALTFTNGSNLKIGSDFVTTADDTISLLFDGTNFYQLSRSIN